MATFSIIPAAILPGYNPVVYTFNSTLNANTGFRYLIDIYSGTTQVNLIARLKVIPQEDGTGRVDISKIINNYLGDSSRNINSFTFFEDDLTEAYLSYNVALGEEYQASWVYGKAISATTGTYAGYTVLSATSASTFVVNDQINISTLSTGPATNLNGLHTVLSASSSQTQVIINLPFPITSATTINVPGTVTYADSRKVQFSGQTVYTGTYIFNGSLDWRPWRDWSLSNYLISTSTPSTTKYLLTSLQPQSDVTDASRRFYMTPTQAIFLNFFNDVTADAYAVQAFQYNKTGTQVDSYLNDFLVGGGAIKQFRAGFDTFGFTTVNEGDYMVLNIVKFSGVTQLSRNYVIYADTRCARETNIILFQDRWGSLLSQNFTLNSTNKIDVTRDIVKVPINYTTNSALPLKDSGTIITNVDFNRSYDLQTDWISDANIELIEELITSRNTWMLVNNIYVPVIVQDKGYEITYQRNKRLQRKNITVQLANNRPIN